MAEVREFETGATRDLDTGKLDYEGFLSHAVLERYAQYMHKNRQTAAGLRDSDNWQKGIPLPVYMKSAWRHFMEWWRAHRRGEVDEEALCAMMFNVMGYLHEVLKTKKAPSPGVVIPCVDAHTISKEELMRYQNFGENVKGY